MAKNSFKSVRLSYDSTAVPPDQQLLLHANQQDSAKPLTNFPVSACYLYVKKLPRLGGVDMLFV